MVALVVLHCAVNTMIYPLTDATDVAFVVTLVAVHLLINYLEVNLHLVLFFAFLFLANQHHPPKAVWHWASL